MFNERECPNCGTTVIDVRDEFSGATFPVNAQASVGDGFTLEKPEPGSGQRNAKATRTSLKVYVPHAPMCDLLRDTQKLIDAPAEGVIDPDDETPDG